MMGFAALYPSYEFTLPLKLARDLRQHLKQRQAILRAQQLVEPCLMLAGYELLGPRQHGAALVGEQQDMRAAVARRAHALTQAAAFPADEHGLEVGAEDAERARDLGLVATGVLVQQQQHRELRRRELQRRDAAQEILENLELRP